MDLRASIEVWLHVLSLSNPKEPVFAAEIQKPYARLATAVIWLVSAGLVTVLVWLLVFTLLDPMGQSLTMMPELLAQMGISAEESADLISQMEDTAQISMLMMLCGMLFGIPLLGLGWSGVLWLAAKMMGGAGSYEKQTFLFSSFATPLVMLSAIIYLFPLLGPLVVVALVLYNLYLTFLALKVVHQLPTEKAATAVAAPVVFLLVFACCAATLWLSMLGAAMGA